MSGDLTCAMCDRPLANHAGLVERSMQIVEDALRTNYRRIGRSTLGEYRRHLCHYAEYLGHVAEIEITTARKRHIRHFISHLEAPGGANPDPSRLDCPWCKGRGYPTGRSGDKYSSSTVVSAWLALRFVYWHLAQEDDHATYNPTTDVLSPRREESRQYVPTRAEVRALLDVEGGPKDRLIAHWLYYAPSRVAPLCTTVWSDIDLDDAHPVWRLVGKGSKREAFALHPVLVGEFRSYREWQECQASEHPAMARALSQPATAYVLMTTNGRPMRDCGVRDTLKRRAARAGIAVYPSNVKYSRRGLASQMTPHALRRAWACHRLNDPKHPVPLDVISKALHHQSIETTRKYYAMTEDARAAHALVTAEL